MNKYQPKVVFVQTNIMNKIKKNVEKNQENDMKGLKMNSVNNFYCYILKYPDGIPFYVGKGRGYRYKRHLTKWNIKNDTNGLKVNVINKIRNSGKEPLAEIIKTNLTEDEAFTLEIEIIKKYGKRCEGGILTNMSDGGEGQTGYHHTEKLKSEFSKRFSKEKNPFFGKRHTEESLKLIGNTNRGKILNENWRQKISVATKGRKMSDEHKEKIRIANKNRIKTPDEIQRLVDLNKSRKGIPLTEEHRKKLSLSTKGIPKGKMSEETKNKIRQAKLKKYEKH